MSQAPQIVAQTASNAEVSIVQKLEIDILPNTTKNNDSDKLFRPIHRATKGILPNNEIQKDRPLRTQIWHG